MVPLVQAVERKKPRCHPPTYSYILSLRLPFIDMWSLLKRSDASFGATLHSRLQLHMSVFLCLYQGQDMSHSSLAVC